MKRELSDYTEREFIEFMNGIVTVDASLYPSERAHTKAILEFKRLASHPSGTDLLYYPKKHGLTGSLVEVVEVIKQWRSAQGLAGFRAD